MLTPQLEQEGHARELVRHIQQLRKDAGLDISDRITLYVADTKWAALVRTVLDGAKTPAFGASPLRAGRDADDGVKVEWGGGRWGGVDELCVGWGGGDGRGGENLMSRRDTYHQIVRAALEAEGWTITHDPYYFEADPVLATDLGAEKVIAAQRESMKIAVEIKSFHLDSQVVDLQRAVGQYILYAAFLTRQEPERTLYLAVPTWAHEGIFATQVGQVAIDRANLKLIVYSLNEGKELIWKTS